MSRHPATEHLLRQFEFEYFDAHLREVSRACRILARDMTDELPEGPELSAGLRKLLEAKDCFVRSAVETKEPDDDGD